jgi:alcohol dehydrogenase
MDTMKAMVFKEIGRIVLEDVLHPTITEPSDAIVRVTHSCICGSDLHIMHGALPMEPGKIVGHEFLGVVDEVGDCVTKFKPGDKVLVKAVIKCEVCEECRTNQPHCPQIGIFGNTGNVGGIDGGQAEYVRIPLANNTLIKKPDDLTEESLMFVTDILSTGYFAAEKGNIEPGDTVAVFGCGPVGICALACAQLFGPSKIFAVDMQSDRLKMAERYGAIPINASEVKAHQKIRELTGGSGVNVAIEAVGEPATLLGCLKSVKTRSNISSIGSFSKPVEFPMQKISLTQKTITMGAPSNMAEYIPRLIELIRCGKIDMTPLITHILPLRQGERAYELIDKRLDGVMKIILKPGE